MASDLREPDDGLCPHALSEGIPEVQSGAWQVLSWQVTGWLERREKRIVFGRLTYRERARRQILAKDLVAKLYPDGRGAVALGVLQQLWTSGFRSPELNRVPRAYGFARHRGTLLQAYAPGRPWADFLLQDEQTCSAVSARAASWLVKLQRHPASAPVVAAADRAAEHAWASELGLAFPQYARRLGLIAEHLARRLQREPGPLVLSHGDFHPKNILVTTASTTVIDFDHFGAREAAFDVGYAIAHLLSGSYLKLGTLAPGGRASLAFWRRYEQDAPEVAWPRVAAQVARTLLQITHFMLCPMQADRPDVLELFPDLMEACLDSKDPTPLEALLDGAGRGPCPAGSERSLRDLAEPNRDPLRSRDPWA
jgi:hypothetical protein